MDISGTGVADEVSVKIDHAKLAKQSHLLTLYALDCDQVVYVGRAANLATRMYDHYVGNGSRITKKFKPRNLLFTVALKVPKRNGQFNQAVSNDLERQFACHVAWLTKRPVSISGPECAPQIDLTHLFDGIVTHKSGDLLTFVNAAAASGVRLRGRSDDTLSPPITKPVSEWQVHHYSLSIGITTKDLLPTKPQSVNVENNGLLQSPSQLLPDASSVQ